MSSTFYPQLVFPDFALTPSSTAEQTYVTDDEAVECYSLMPIRTAEDVLAIPCVAEAASRGIVRVSDNRVTYFLNQERSYDWTDPEEWVRCHALAWLIIERDYPANRMRTEVTVPRRTPSDYADIVVYSDDGCRQPYLIVENKADAQRRQARTQAIEQLFGNCNSLRSPLGLYDEYGFSCLYDVANHPATEREANRLGERGALPRQYGHVPVYAHIAGEQNDIAAVRSATLETKIRRAHSIIWAGGRRDPLTAFDEWSKLLFAKVIDERTTPTGQPRRFQVGTNETIAAIANRIHVLFSQACREDPTIFSNGVRINLPDTKIAEVVRTLQDASFTRTDIDSIGRAFEQFFGAVFRGGLGQYFTMRQLARFTVGILDVAQNDYVLDPTAGSGGFLLEALLQTWHRIDREFAGQPADNIQRRKIDFALQNVFGIEVHEILARICKINLMLHHDGHTNIEGNRSCLDSVFVNPRLSPPRERFTVVVGNPPFGDDVEEGDEDKLGANHLENFRVASGRKKVDSEQVILERSIDFLEPGGRLGLVVPDGLLNNQGEQSNCPRTRRLVASSGRIEAIVSLPDYAFRKSGAQNKTSILFFKKFTRLEKRNFEHEYQVAQEAGESESNSIRIAVSQAGLNYRIFLAEANWVGYSPTGAPSQNNELYTPSPDDGLSEDQGGTILGEWRIFLTSPNTYQGRTRPDCTSLTFEELWSAHDSNRLDPKYYLFKREAARGVPQGWVRVPISTVMRRRTELAAPEDQPDQMFKVMTISQTGEIRLREAGKGNNPPEWLGSYFEDMPADWYAARAGDVVYSSIDLWKGCIAVVPDSFDSGLVTKEFPIYEITDRRLDVDFLQCLLRSRYYQRAFRAITTGHSNRRRTQGNDFEVLEIAFPEDVNEQRRLIANILVARQDQRLSAERLSQELLDFSAVIDGRGTEELPEIDATPSENGEDNDNDQ
jgi:type I restriction enzyme M protein